jgi:hypothetical protein
MATRVGKVKVRGGCAAAAEGRGELSAASPSAPSRSARAWIHRASRLLLSRALVARRLFS